MKNHGLSFLSDCKKILVGMTILAVCIISAAGQTATPVPSTQPPDPTGTIIVEDNDADSVALNFPGKSAKPEPSAEASGGTSLGFGTWNKPGTGDHKITISPSIPADGLYQVWMRWVTSHVWNGYARNVPVRIEHTKGVEGFHLNQQMGNHWILLGTYPFKAGRQKVMELSNDGIFGLADFDAVKFIPVSQEPKAHPAPPQSAATDDTGRLVRAISAYQIASRYGRGEAETDPDIRHKAEGAERSAGISWHTMHAAIPDGKTLWQDTNVGGASWGLRFEAQRLCDMSAAYAGATNWLGGDMRGNPALLKDILDGLHAFSTRYNAGTKWGVNWFDYEIGIPESVLPALCLLGDAAPADMVKDYIAAVDHFTSDPKKFYNKGFPSTGANRLWLSRVHLYWGALEKDSMRLKITSDAVVEPLRFVTRDLKKPDAGVDGFFADGSFIQHSGHAYIGAYGYLMLDAYSEVAALFKGTPWEIREPEASNPFEMMRLSFDPFVVRGELVATVLGRGIGNMDHEGYSKGASFLVTACKLLPFASATQAVDLKGLLKKWILDDGGGGVVTASGSQADAATLASVKTLASDTTTPPAKERTGFQIFPNMERAMHRSGSWVAALGMNSTRMFTYESIWGANRRGWFQSEGVLYLYTPDIGRYRDGYFAVSDPYRLPGTTVERFPRPEGEGGGGNVGKMGGSDFVGGLESGGLGVAAMHVKPQEGALDAHKAWFFFNDQIICLGAGIAVNTGTNIVETTVENAQLTDSGQELQVDDQKAADGAAVWKGAKWAYLSSTQKGGGIGWIFLGDNVPLNTLLEKRTGSRLDICKGADPTPVTHSYATLWFDHGAGATGGSYAYMVLPGRDMAQVKAAAVSSAACVLSNTADLQAVRIPPATTGLVASKPGQMGGISVDQPCLLLVSLQGNHLIVAASDPTMKLDKPLHVKIEVRPGTPIKSDAGVKVVSRAPLEIEFDLQGALGTTRSAEFGM